MSRIPKSSPRELVPEGAHTAVLVQIIDLGTQEAGDFGPKHKIQFGYDCVDEKTDGGDNMLAYRQYTFSSSAKGNLMKDLKTGFGIKDPEVELDDLLGKACMITIEHKETDSGTFANIVNVGQLPKGTKARKSSEPMKSLYLDDTFDQDVYDELPDFLKEKIAGSPEYAEIMAPRMRKKPQQLPDKNKGKGKAQPTKGRR